MIAFFSYFPYIKSLHKEATASHYLSVAWQIPGGAFEGPIPGNCLSPYSTSSLTTRNSGNFAYAMVKATNSKELLLSATPNPATSYFMVTVKSNSSELLSCIISDMAVGWWKENRICQLTKLSMLAASCLQVFTCCRLCRDRSKKH